MRNVATFPPIFLVARISAEIAAARQRRIAKQVENRYCKEIHLQYL